MESISGPADMSTKMAQLNLQTNGSTSTTDASAAATTLPADPTNVNNNNVNSGLASRPRTGIPRYAIPYRRPDDRPSVDEGARLPVSPTSSETTSSCQPPISRGRNGVRTESLGDDYIPSTYGVGAPQRYGRAASVDPLRGDSESEHSSAFSASGQPRRITSKIGSFANANYRPGGGNVRILETKVDFSYAHSKCNSKANLKHKPGGGDVQIFDNKLTFKENSKPRINSLANAKHVPGGGNVKIESHKLEFRETAAPRVGSLQNASHKAGGGDVKIFNEKLPWLKYNKPNLTPEERAKINKHASLAPDTTNEPIYTSRHSSTTS